MVIGNLCNQLFDVVLLRFSAVVRHNQVTVTVSDKVLSKAICSDKRCSVA